MISIKNIIVNNNNTIVDDILIIKLNDRLQYFVLAPLYAYRYRYPVIQPRRSTCV